MWTKSKHVHKWTFRQDVNEFLKKKLFSTRKGRRKKSCMHFQTTTNSRMVLKSVIRYFRLAKWTFYSYSPSIIYVRSLDTKRNEIDKQNNWNQSKKIRSQFNWKFSLEITSGPNESIRWFKIVKSFHRKITFQRHVNALWLLHLFIWQNSLFECSYLWQRKHHSIKYGN